jgi:SSS family transporter
MSGADWIIIALYLAAMLGLAARLGHGQSGLEDYYLGGRRLPWWSVGLSTLATQSSAISFLSIPAFVALRPGGGLAWLQYEIAVAPAMIVLALWLVPALRAQKVVTIYEILERRFDRRVRRAVAFAFLLGRGLATGIGVYATALVLEGCLGTSPATNILLVGGITVLYDLMGGMAAVVWSDVVQSFVLFVGLLVCVFVAAGAGDGFTAAFASFPLERRATLAGIDDPTTPFWAFVVGGWFLYLSYYGCDQSQAQRLLSTADARGAQKALLLNGVARFPLTLTYVLLGVLAAALISAGGPLAEAVDASRPDALVPELVALYLPPGLRGLVFAALLAAAMSSLDSALNALSASTVRDFLDTEDGGDPRAAIRQGRWSTAAWGLAITAFAFRAGDISPTVIEAINKTGSALYGPVLAVFALALWSNRADARGTLAGLFAGLGTNLLFWMAVPGLHWMWWNAIGFMATSGMALALSRNEPRRRFPLARAAPPADSIMSIALPLFVYWIAVLAVIAALDPTAA